MEAYAIAAPFDADFADHDWAVENIKNQAGRASDFSTLWSGTDSDLMLNTLDDAVYFYGGRSAIYAALEAYEYARIRNFVDGHRNLPIHVYRAVVKVANLPGAKTKQIIMLTVADSDRDQELAAFRDRDLEEPPSDAHTYRMRGFRSRMKRKWPEMADD